MVHFHFRLFNQRVFVKFMNLGNRWEYQNHDFDVNQMSVMVPLVPVIRNKAIVTPLIQIEWTDNKYIVHYDKYHDENGDIRK